MSYAKPTDNQWIQPVRKGYRMACCDCGLVHEMDFRIYKGRVQFRARRHPRATGGKRATMPSRYMPGLPKGSRYLQAKIVIKEGRVRSCVRA